MRAHYIPCWRFYMWLFLCGYRRRAMPVQVHMHRMAAHRHKHASNPLSIHMVRSQQQKKVAPRRSGISWLLWSGCRLSQFQRLAGMHAARSHESRRSQTKAPEGDRWHILGVGNHICGGCESKFDNVLHQNASLAHHEYFPQLTRTRIDAQHVPARPAVRAWFINHDWRPRSVPSCLSALWIQGSGLENVKHV